MHSESLMLSELLADQELTLLLARWQMAFTLGSHIILACFGVGMPWLILAAEAIWLRTDDSLWYQLARRWSKAFAVMFAVGAVSGTVLSFELGLLWPRFMETFGSVIGLPFTMEGFAFFLEAIFAGIYLYGWGRLEGWWHWLTGVPIAISGVMSAWFVVTANAWMNTPQGFDWDGQSATDPRPIEAMLNAATGAQTTHMILAAFMVTGFVVAAYYAWRLLKQPSCTYSQRALALGLTMGVLITPFQMWVGDWSAKVVAESQPVKLAAMESHFETARGAHLLIGGVPDIENSEVRYGIKVPGMLSFLAFGDFEAEVLGLEEFPREHWPPVPIVHVAFQVMVGIGTWLMLLSAISIGIAIKRPRLEKVRWWLWLVIVSGPLVVIAMEAGWVVTEVGRQPWIAQGYMYTRDAVQEQGGLLPLFISTLVIYGVLAFGTIFTLRRLASIPLEQTDAS